MSKLPIPFDNPATYAGHSGIDYPQRRGTIFRASGPGTVTTLGRNSGGGFYIWVQYDNGPEVGYHHMDSHDGCPARWSRVDEGTQLGYVGNTGNSTGPHLHSEVRGAATTAGYWRYFDRNTVVGASGGSTSSAASAPPESQEDEMRHIVVNDNIDGNNVGGVALINPSWREDSDNPEPYLIIRFDEPDYQERANRWAEVWGNARPVQRQSFLDAIDAVKKTT